VLGEFRLYGGWFATDLRSDSLVAEESKESVVVSVIVGLGVGVLYGLIRVKSRHRPSVALIGLLGMVLGNSRGVGSHDRT